MSIAARAPRRAPGATRPGSGAAVLAVPAADDARGPARREDDVWRGPRC